MTRILLSVLAACLCASLCLSLVPAAASRSATDPGAGTADPSWAHKNKVLGIQWQSSLAGAQALAKEEHRVVFIAINMDGEAGNDRMVKKVYPDKAIQALAAETVNLCASIHSHGSRGSCSRLGGVPCQVHQSVEIRVREEIFGGDETTPVIAPHHVFLGPDGKVLMSVPYEVSVSELEWCFHASMDAVDAGLGEGLQPHARPKRSPSARPPRRLLRGSVMKLTKSSLAPLTQEQAATFIKEVNKGNFGEDYQLMMERLAAADLPEALDFVETALRAGAKGGYVSPAILELLRAIGARSPVSYWKVCTEFCSGVPEEIQHEAIVALEQLGSPKALTALHRALRKTKAPLIRRCLLRALGACGQGDSKTRTVLLKAAADKKAPEARANALIALGWLDEHEAVSVRLRQGLLPEEFGVGLKIEVGEVTERERAGAAVAMGLSRNPEWLPLLERAAEAPSSSASVKEAIAAAVETIKTSRFQPLGPALKRAGGDTIPRDRFFGK